MGERDHLGDEAAEGEAEQTDLLQTERVEERDSVIGHLLGGVRSRARGAADAGVVESDHVALGREAVDQGRVPVVDVPSEAWISCRSADAKAAVESEGMFFLELEMIEPIAAGHTM
jgi:hypothetical protein